MAVLALAIGVGASGCSLVAPPYTASLQNVQTLKDGGDYTARVGAFDSRKDPANANPISIRGSSLSSPYGESYATYLAEALKQELTLAGKWAAGSEVEVSGVLMKNDLDASGINVGEGVIEARFVVRAGAQAKYDKLKSARTEWESSFAGAVAIPRAQQEYPRLVQRLLEALYADPEFLAALKP